MTMLAAMIDQSSVVNGMAVRVGERSVAALLAFDVRASRERERKPIRGRVRVPLDRPLLVYCAGGYHSSIAASLLQRQGITKVSEMAAGIP